MRSNWQPRQLPSTPDSKPSCYSRRGNVALYKKAALLLVCELCAAAFGCVYLPIAPNTSSFSEFRDDSVVIAVLPIVYDGKDY